MRRLVVAAAACAAGPALAQTPPAAVSPPGPPVNPIGRPDPGPNPIGPASSAGLRTPPVAGAMVGRAAGTRPGAGYPTSPTTDLPGQQVDPSRVVGPLPGTEVKPPDKSLWDRFVEKYGVSLGIIPPPPQAPRWTPGIARRNRERTEERLMTRWWRD